MAEVVNVPLSFTLFRGDFYDSLLIEYDIFHIPQGQQNAINGFEI